jgi:hypothetical protein
MEEQKKRSIIDVDSLLQLHRFGDLFERAANAVESDLVSLEPLRTAPDSIGRHWYGMRLRVVSKTSGVQFYLHTGLIYLPKTRIGLMVEVDQKNNLDAYETLWEQLADGPEFEVNHDEAEYLKLFLPDGAFTELFELDAPGQVKRLSRYLQSCAEAIARSEDSRGFRLKLDALTGAYELALLFEQAFYTCDQTACRVRMNNADKDNFGQYASGYRYYLENPDGTVSLYAYFGAIYSYKKRPRGVFMEIDRYSNPEWFDHTASHFQEDAAFCASRAEDGFIKLFLPKEMQHRFQEADADEQLAILTEFLNACNARIIEAATTRR